MTDRTLLGKSLTGDEIETELLRFMLERLSNTPLMIKNSRGEDLNQTQRVFWAIKFVKDIAEERGLELE